MSEPRLPQAAEIFVSFAGLLRRNGFAIAPEQTTAFLAAIELLGPNSLDDIRRAGAATLAPPPERLPTYNLLFDIHFGVTEAAALSDTDQQDDIVRLQEEGDGGVDPDLAQEQNESGLTATRAEALVARRLGTTTGGNALQRLARQARARLPKRRGHRRMRARRGSFVDLRRTLRESVRRDG